MKNYVSPPLIQIPKSGFYRLFTCLACNLLFSFGAFAQDGRTITGKVTSAEDKTGIPGVSILIKGTSEGTVTDIDGDYSLQVAGPASILVFSFVGYNTKEVRVGDQEVVHVSLAPDVAELDEVVVVGYGTQQRRDVTGSIASIDAKELEKVEAHSFVNSLQGRVPGVQISGTSGGPGAGSSVRIRGVGTTGGGGPLYVVDGFPVSSGNMGIPGSSEDISGLSVINPNDIASIEILKDAAAASIYGARAANGVVLITTKRGAAGKPAINISGYTGFSQVWRKPEVLNAEELAVLANELWVNSGITPHPDFANPDALGEGTDWIDAIFRNAPVSNLDFSVSGGTKNLQARLSLGYLDQEGTIIETGHTRYTGRANVDFTPGERLRFGGSFAFTLTEGKGVRNELHNRGIINLSQQMFPHLGLDDVIGENVPYATSQADNPVLRARDQDYTVNDINSVINGFGEFEILEDLLFRTSVGVEFNNTRASEWNPTADRGFFRNLRAELYENYSRGTNLLIENTLSYSIQLEKHKVSAVIGQTAQARNTDWISATGIDYLNEQVRVINGSNANERLASGTEGQYRLASYLGRVNYSYDDRYMISASIRRDGSSNFGPEYKWGNFPSVSAGWNILRESFMQNVPYLAQLKLRGSWGRLGNDNIGAFGYLSTFSLGTSSSNYILGVNQDLMVGAHLARPGNEGLKWETSEQINFAIDAGFFKNKVYTTVEYYEKTTKDLLVALPISFEAGFPSAPSVNGGKILNKGWEFQLGYQDQAGDFNWDISANLSTLYNEVLSLGEGQPIPGGMVMYGSSMPITYTEVGEEIGYFKGLVVEGIYQTEDEIDTEFQPNAHPGDFQWKDIDGDGLLTTADEVKLGSPWPDLTYGAGLNLSYRNLDLNVILTGIAGSEIMNKMIESVYPVRYFGGSGIVNARKEALDRWTPESGGNTIPRLIVDDANGNYSHMSSFYIEDGDYMRIRNVTLGYTFGSLRGKLISNARVYITAQNLFTFTQYTGFDPEVPTSNPLSAGIDDGVYPMPRTFMLGFNLTL